MTELNQLRLCLDHYVNGSTLMELCKKYGCSQVTLSEILTESMANPYIRKRVTEDLQIVQGKVRIETPEQKLLGYKSDSYWSTEEDLMMQLNGGYTIESKLNYE